MKILLTGVTGLIGKELSISLLRNGHDVFALARRPDSVSFLPSNRVSMWEVGRYPLKSSFVEGMDAIIHLAGVPVADGRWTDARKNEIESSRVLGSQEWVDVLTRMPLEKRPKVFIGASAIGIYGSRGDENLDESSIAGSGFLAEVTTKWEAATLPIRDLGIRLVLLRTGIVLSRLGGALSQMQPVALGSGSQWMSWIHIEDEIRLIEFALSNSSVEGPLNLVAPNPVTNQEFTKAFANTIHVPIVLNAPQFTIRAALGEMADVVLSSQRVFPAKALASGFQFRYTDIHQALTEIYQDRPHLETYFESAQFVPETLEKVFFFFSRPENLGTLTPDFLDFKILKQSTPEIEKGTLVDYRIKIHGVPVVWRTLIEEWNELESFVDTQLKGPYSRWHHQHLFFAVKGGTLIMDRVTYRVPAKFLGKLLLGKFIRSDVEKIFEYRRSKIQTLFGGEART